MAVDSYMTAVLCLEEEGGIGSPTPDSRINYGNNSSSQRSHNAKQRIPDFPIESFISGKGFVTKILETFSGKKP